MKASSGSPRINLPAEGFIARAQLLQIIPFSASTLARLVSEGSFPRPVRIAKRLNGWDVSAVRNWMESRGAEA